MKRVFLICFLPFITLCSYAQRKDITPLMNINGVLKVNFEGHEKGTPVTITQVLKMKKSRDERLKGILVSASIGHQVIAIPGNEVAKTVELIPADKEEFWMCEYINHNMFKLYDKKGYRHKLRNEIIAEADDYQNSLSNSFYKEAYIQDYVQGIFSGIMPYDLDNKRPEKVNVEILQSPNPDTYILPNGTLLVSTGLLSTIDSPDELTAIIASEIAHYVLDHHLINTAKEKARVRRAEFWGAALVVAAAGAEAVLSVNDEDYVPGGILLPAAIANGIINEAAIKRLGMGYTDKQINDADDIAVKFLELNGMNTGALASALHKIVTYYKLENDTYALSREGGYGNADSRIARLGEVKNLSNRSYQKAVSGVATVNAIILQNSKNYQAAERIIKKKIKSNLATDEDYLILVKSNMTRRDTPESNQENLELIAKAKELSPNPNLGLYKQEILLLLRMKKQAKASESLQEYMSMLSEFKEYSTNDDDINWASKEIGWASNLLRQVSFL